MPRYALNLPQELKQEAEKLARQQDVSLNQFLMWSVAEKVASLRSQINDPRFPHIVYRFGAAGAPTPVLLRTNLRVQTVVVAVNTWAYTSEQAAREFDLTLAEVQQALAFYDLHRVEIDAALQAEAALETAHVATHG